MLEISLRQVLLLALTLLLFNCGRTRTPVSSPRVSETVLDLVAGWRLRVVAPVLKDPNKAERLLPAQSDGTRSITVQSSSNLLGFETQYIAVLGRQTRVHLKFQRATLTIDGITKDEARPLRNYFPLPAGNLPDQAHLSNALQ